MEIAQELPQQLVTMEHLHTLILGVVGRLSPLSVEKLQVLILSVLTMPTVVGLSLLL